MSDTGIPTSTPQLVQIAVTGLMDTQPLDHLESGSEQEEENGEPPLKRGRVDVDFAIDSGASIKQILFNINKAICMRLDGMENYLTSLGARTRDIELKLDQLIQATKQQSQLNQSNMKKGAVIVGLPQQNPKPGCGDSSDVDSSTPGSFSCMESIQSLGPNVTLITLNSEEDYPNGTWLGDEGNPEMRVRTSITASDLLHIHSNCRTPEKMALTLLDYLFDRDIQASSNLSGQGKHGKKQLDPLMIYGIRCHLISKFGITEADWHRIKQNIDSKCRTAFRRKQRGMPLTVKAFRGKSTSYITPNSGDLMTSDDDSLTQDDSGLTIHHGDVYLQGEIQDLQQSVSLPDGNLQGEVQILHATPEQISQLQQAHHIQILQGDHIIQVPVPHVPSLQSPDLQDSLQENSSQPSVTVAPISEALQITLNMDNDELDKK